MKQPLVQSFSALLTRQPPVAVALETTFAVLIVVVFWLVSGRATLYNYDARPSSDLSITDSVRSAAGVRTTNRAGSQAEIARWESCRQILVNGDFEGDDFEGQGWTMPITARPAAVTSELAYRGGRSLRLGIPEQGTNLASYSTAYQWITLPGDVVRATLRAQVWRGSNDADQDTQYLWVTATDSNHTVFWERRDSRAWESVETDLTELQGQRVRVLFGTYNDGRRGKSVMYVDEVAVEVCELSTVEPTPTETAADGALVYLPMVHKENRVPTPTPSPTATATPTVTPAPPTCQQLLANGGFEENREWSMPTTARPAIYATDQVLAGQRSLRLGLLATDSNVLSHSTAYQWLTLPTDAARITLRASVWQASTAADGDYQYIWVTVNSRHYRALQGRSDGRRWQDVTYDLTPFRGERVRVLLGTYNDGHNGRAVMYVDEAAVDACRQDTTAPTPTRQPTSTPTSTPTPSQHAPMAAMRSPDFGAQAFLWWRSEIADRDLTLMDKAGFNWVRQTFAWEDIEGAGKGQFSWERADRVVRQVNAGGLKLLARLSSNPDLRDFWAGKPPGNSDAFADFVYAVTNRYNCTPQAMGCIQAYQVWNEPNLAREWGGNRPNPGQYVQFLGKAYRAIKRANPNAIVISAGMAPTGTDNAGAMPDEKFYREMYRAMGSNSDGYFDLLGVHAAGFAAPPELDPAEAAANSKYGGHRFFSFRHAEDIRAIMVENGDGNKRVAVLEFGWTSDPVNPDYVWHGAGAGIDEFVKADYLVRAYRYAEEHWRPWIGVMSLLTMPNLDWLADGNPEDEEQYWWAIMEPSNIDELRLRPAYVELCIYFNGIDGKVCEFDPNR